MTNELSDPRRLNDDQLVDALRGLAVRERQATADLVAHLAVFDARELHLRLGHSSLFAYCREVLHLSEHEAYNRIEAARACRRHPQVLEQMRGGSVTLTSIRLLAPLLDDGNCDRLLAAAAHCTRRQVEELIARERPRPDVSDRVRKLPARTAVPLAPDRYEIRFTAGAGTCAKLRQARDLLRHAVPGGETAEIVDRALSLLVEHLMKARFAAVRRPRSGRAPAPDARPVGASVKRQVYERDGGRCAFVGSRGRRCDARTLLEYHHVRPWAAAGPGTVENVQLRCRAHNQHEARAYFGPIHEARQRELEAQGPGDTRSETSQAAP